MRSGHETLLTWNLCEDAEPRKACHEDCTPMADTARDEESYWSVAEVARHLDRTESLVRQLIRDGRLGAQSNSASGPGVGRGAKTRYEIPRSELLRYCELHGLQPPGVTPPPRAIEHQGAVGARSGRSPQTARNHAVEAGGAHRGDGDSGLDAALLRELQIAERSMLQEQIARLEAELRSRDVMLQMRDVENSRLRGLVRDLSTAVSRSVEELEQS